MIVSTAKYRQDRRKTNSTHRELAKKMLEYRKSIICPICGTKIRKSDKFELAHIRPFWIERDSVPHNVVMTHACCNQHFPDNADIDLAPFKKEELGLVYIK